MAEQNNGYGAKVAQGLFWSLGEKILSNGVSFIVSLILARLIMPEEYGLIALIAIFINISDVFVSSGFGTALIQKKNADDEDFDSIFIFGLLVALAFYFVLFFLAPLIAQFYEQPQLVSIVRIYGITIILGSIKNVQHAYVSKNMQFRLFFFSTLGGTLASAVVGVGLAYAGFGVWALVAQVLANSIMDSIVLFLKIKWKPKLRFSIERIKRLYSFGWKLLATNLLSTVYNNLYGLIIGKIYNTEVLAVYNKGNSFPTLIINNAIGPIQGTTFPALAQVQNDKKRLRYMVSKTMQVSGYIIWPMLIGLACVAQPMIDVLITSKWAGCVIFLQINAVASIFAPISSANGQVINALGRSDISLKLDIVKKIIGLVFLVVTIPFGIIPFAMGRAGGIFVASLLDIYPNRKLLDYGYLNQIKDVASTLMCSVIMAAAVIAVGVAFPLGNVSKLIVQILTGLIVYIIASLVIKPHGYLYMLNMVKNKLDNMRK